MASGPARGTRPGIACTLQRTVIERLGRPVHGTVSQTAWSVPQVNALNLRPVSTIDFPFLLGNTVKVADPFATSRVSV
jgi:hypothetical protein